jgi:hypothetical protein
MTETLARGGNAPFPNSRARFLEIMQEQRATWRELVRVSGVQPEG